MHVTDYEEKDRRARRGMARSREKWRNKYLAREHLTCETYRTRDWKKEGHITVYKYLVSPQRLRPKDLHCYIKPSAVLPVAWEVNTQLCPGCLLGRLDTECPFSHWMT